MQPLLDGFIIKIKVKSREIYLFKSSKIQKGAFIFRYRYLRKFKGLIRNKWFALFGMKVGSGTYLPQISVTWPHNISIGKDCKLEHGIYFKFDGIWQPGAAIEIGNRVFIGSYCEFNIAKGISIGDDSLVASGCRFIDHDHGINNDQLVRDQISPAEEISIGKDVWLGCNVIILKGVKVGDGAIIAAGAVVTKSVNYREIWAGIPAKKIGSRE